MPDPVAGAGGEGDSPGEGNGARDAGVPTDAGIPADAGIVIDAGPLEDAGDPDATPANGLCPSNPAPAVLELSEWNEPTPKRTPQEAFDTASEYIVGSWRGIVTTPWVPDYEVSFWFDAAGHYGGSCAVLSDQCCVALYYGTDRDCDLKRYSIDDATLSGKVTGTIDVAFYAPDAPDGCYLAGWQGELSNVAVDADFDRLRFDFKTSDGYGPVHFELERVVKEDPRRP